MPCCFFPFFPLSDDDTFEDLTPDVGLKITVFFNDDAEALKEEQVYEKIMSDQEGKKASARLREEYCEENLAWESSSYAEEIKLKIKQPSSFLLRTYSGNTSASIASNADIFNKMTDVIMSQNDEFDYILEKYGHCEEDDAFDGRLIYETSVKMMGINNKDNVKVKDKEMFQRDEHSTDQVEEFQDSDDDVLPACTIDSNDELPATSNPPQSEQSHKTSAQITTVAITNNIKAPRKAIKRKVKKASLVKRILDFVFFTSKSNMGDYAKRAKGK